MDKLPEEIVLRVADFLEPTVDYAMSDPPLDTRRLYALALTSRRHARILLPRIYRLPHLVSPEKAKYWAARYSSLVDPFRLARELPPQDVVRPTELVLDFPPIIRVGNGSRFKRTLEYRRYLLSGPPNIAPAIYHFDLFRNLTSLFVRNCRLDADFLPLLLTPGKPLRRNLVTLELIGCSRCDYISGSPEDPGLERALMFVFEALACLKDADYRCARFLDEGEKLWDLGEEHQNPRLHREAAAAHADFQRFSRLWYFDAGPFEMQGHPTCCPFSSIHSMGIPLVNEAMVWLILGTSSFPSLSELHLLPAGPELFFPFSTLQLLRYSITRVAPDDEAGFLYPPNMPLRDLDDLSDAYGDPHAFLPSYPWPPLSAAEQQKWPYGRYRGPQLEVLDLRGCVVEFA
ncbi:hypothetical protein JCM10213_001055 [Rhodosporidiobolus nylandii]